MPCFVLNLDRTASRLDALKIAHGFSRGYHVEPNTRVPSGTKEPLCPTNREILERSSLLHPYIYASTLMASKRSVQDALKLAT